MSIRIYLISCGLFYWNKDPFSMLFYEVSPYLLLLYKQLPNKVKIIKINFIIYFIGLSLFSEVKLYSSTSLIFSKYCISYRSHPASRWNLWAHPGSRRGFLWSSSQYCWNNWSPELRFGRTPAYWPHRHLCRQAPVHNPIILNYATYCYYFLVHLSY